MRELFLFKVAFVDFGPLPKAHYAFSYPKWLLLLPVVIPFSCVLFFRLYDFSGSFLVKCNTSTADLESHGRWTV